MERRELAYIAFSRARPHLCVVCYNGESPWLSDQGLHGEFIDQTKTLVGALGCDLFKVVSGDLINRNKLEIPASASAPNVVFAYHGKGFAAQMSITASSEFVVKNGSVARIKTTNTIPKGTVALRSDKTYAEWEEAENSTPPPNPELEF